MEDIFKKQKKQTLAGVDLSRKGSIDAPIKDLVDFINAHDAFVTTSSCSGRVTVYEQNLHGSSGKQGCRWLYTTHDECKTEDVVAALKESCGDAFFKFEPFVLHVQCCTMEDAQRMHADAVASGFRNSGLTVSKKGKIMAAVRSTHSLEAPVSHKGQILVSQQYIEYLVKIANEKMHENLQRINRFSENIRKTLLSKTEYSGPQEDVATPNKLEVTEAEGTTEEKSPSIPTPEELIGCSFVDVVECLDVLYEDT